MEKFFDKLSSYNIFNNLLPGAVLCLLITKNTSWILSNTNLLEDILLFYFVGVVVSRFGSLIIEPLCKFSRIVTFVPYPDYINAAKSDSKIDILSETNNMYRSLLSAIILSALLLCYYTLSVHCIVFEQLKMFFLFFTLIIMFMFSYYKQTQYIKKRVEIVIKDK